MTHSISSKVFFTPSGRSLNFVDFVNSGCPVLKHVSRPKVKRKRERWVTFVVALLAAARIVAGSGWYLQRQTLVKEDFQRSMQHFQRLRLLVVDAVVVSGTWIKMR